MRSRVGARSAHVRRVVDPSVGHDASIKHKESLRNSHCAIVDGGSLSVRRPRYGHRMARWIALLRGVNVNGITIRSAT